MLVLSNQIKILVMHTQPQYRITISRTYVIDSNSTLPSVFTAGVSPPTIVPQGVLNAADLADMVATWPGPIVIHNTGLPNGFQVLASYGDPTAPSELPSPLPFVVHESHRSIAAYSPGQLSGVPMFLALRAIAEEKATQTRYGLKPPADDLTPFCVNIPTLYGCDGAVGFENGGVKLTADLGSFGLRASLFNRSRDRTRAFDHYVSFQPANVAAVISGEGVFVHTTHDFLISLPLNALSPETGLEDLYFSIPLSSWVASEGNAEGAGNVYPTLPQGTPFNSTYIIPLAAIDNITFPFMYGGSMWRSNSPVLLPLSDVECKVVMTIKAVSSATPPLVDIRPI